jgi:hypothetical protein
MREFLVIPFGLLSIGTTHGQRLFAVDEDAMNHLLKTLVWDVIIHHSPSRVTE